MEKLISILLPMFFVCTCAASEARTTIELNGIWDFDQTKTAFPPKAFTRKIPVPGLIHLAEPRIDQYEIFFPRPDTVDYNLHHDLLNRHYEPRYNWYKRSVFVPEELKDSKAMLTILKSKYVTQVFVNGMDMGTSIACYTPIDLPVTDAIRFGRENEILIRVGDRAWLPPEAAGSTDKEKVNYLPGIWDDVSLSFTGNFRVHRELVLPYVSQNKVKVKLLIRNYYPSQTFHGARLKDLCTISVTIRQAKSEKIVAGPVMHKMDIIRDNLTELVLDIPIENAHLWTPEDPFLYVAEILLYENDTICDKTEVRFGMRDFARKGKHFVTGIP